MEINRQKGPLWTDENGMQVELKRISVLEKVREKHAGAIGVKALVVEKALKELRQMIEAAIGAIKLELEKEITADLEIKGHTFYNFDRSVKIFRQVSPLIDFDEGKMQTAHAAFTEFVNKRMTDDQAFLKDMILSAFKTTRGKFDTRKINTLLAQRDNIFVSNDIDFQNAIRLVQEARVVREDRVYDQVYCRDPETREYILVNLNIATVVSASQPGGEKEEK